MTTSFVCRIGVVLLATVASTALAKQPLPANFIGCDAKNTLFFAYTKEGNNAVELCQFKDQYRYTYGPFTIDGQKLKLAPGGAEEAILKPGEAGSIHKDALAGFALKRGNVFTWVSYEEDGTVNLVTAQGGWDGWETPTNQATVVLDNTNRKVINKIEAADTIPFNYDYTNVEYD